MGRALRAARVHGALPRSAHARVARSWPRVRHRGLLSAGPEAGNRGDSPDRGGRVPWSGDSGDRRRRVQPHRPRSLRGAGRGAEREAVAVLGLVQGRAGASRRRRRDPGLGRPRGSAPAEPPKPGRARAHHGLRQVLDVARGGEHRRVEARRRARGGAGLLAGVQPGVPRRQARLRVARRAHARRLQHPRGPRVVGQRHQLPAVQGAVVLAQRPQLLGAGALVRPRQGHVREPHHAQLFGQPRPDEDPQPPQRPQRALPARRRVHDPRPRRTLPLLRGRARRAGQARRARGRPRHAPRDRPPRRVERPKRQKLCQNHRGSRRAASVARGASRRGRRPDSPGAHQRDDVVRARRPLRRRRGRRVQQLGPIAADDAAGG
mmetsp:Transcript_11540/g.53666  ORF Transcript_11540/g.53666 Transcript_11540/m.53666 type:complete len:377 (-) Transcript_11540:1025-2155(-)